jgi:thioredoxin 1
MLLSFSDIPSPFLRVVPLFMSGWHKIQANGYSGTKYAMLLQMDCMDTQKKETLTDILNGQKPVLVDFSAEWCGPCKMMPPILKQLHDNMGEAVRILKIDIDKNQAIASSYNIQSVPTLMLFKQGNVLWRQSGVMQAKQLEQVIRSKA